MRNCLCGLFVFCVTATILCSVTKAGVVITIQEVGGDVVVNGTGMLDLTGAGTAADVSRIGVIQPIGSLLIIGPPSAGAADEYTGLTGPANFGSGTGRGPDSFSGDLIEIDLGPNVFAVPDGYVSNAPLSGMMTFNGASFASLGIDQGSYVWTILSGDTITVNAVPEPSSIALLSVIGVGAAFQLIRRRRRQKNAT